MTERLVWDRTISTGNVVSLVASIVASLVFVLTSWALMAKRIVILEEARITQAQINKDRADTNKEALNEIKAAIESLRKEIKEKK